MRKGYALFITLSFITVMSIVIAQTLDITDKSLKDSISDENYMQIELLTKDIINILRKSPKLNDINNTSDFNTILQAISFVPIKLNSEKNIIIKADTLSYGLDINDLTKWDISLKDKFLNYLRVNGVMMPEFFYDMLFDILNIKSNLTDIKKDMPSVKVGFIGSWRAFERIEEYYADSTNDYDIFNIPWKKIISFNTPLLDANYISCEEWKVLLGENFITPKIDKICKRELYINNLNELELGDEIIKKLKNYGLTTNILKLKITVKLLSKYKKVTMSSFLYDIKTKKVFDVFAVF